MSGEERHDHPFHMYDSILAQPDAFAEVIERNEAAIDRFAAELASSERLFLIGIGTSSHAAFVGESLFRTYGGGVSGHALHSFDFALYGPRLTSEDRVICISHRGNKRYTVAALARAREAGCRTALITGEGGAPDASADLVLSTVGQEKSPAHTVSYTSTIALLALLAERTGLQRTGSGSLPDNFLAEEVPAAIQAALDTETEVAALARENHGRRRIWLAGGGPSAITASEISLKIKETSYLQAEGMSTEALLHGPFQCVEAEDLFVLLAPEGAARERTVELAEAAGTVGAPYLVVSDGTPESLRAGAAGWVSVPPVPEPFTALTCLVPLQLFAYHLALACGTNPDSFRTDDPRFASVRRSVQL